ncbi:MAG: myo-inositol-1-phosphate synthase [Planctomycetota bacterium]|nr:MAG: myo-inositol-1-phosphate synthase [Planctomycetota bacterium]
MKHKRRWGAWLIGAYGAVSTTAILGKLAIEKRLVSPLGMITYLPFMKKISLPPLSEILIGGTDIRSHSVEKTAWEIWEKDRLFSPTLLEELSPYLKEEVETCIVPGVSTEEDPSLSNQEALDRIEKDILSFQKKNALDFVVVVNLASTTSPAPYLENFQEPEDLEKALQSGPSLPSSILYAFAALKNKMGYINFTPSPGTEIPSLSKLALANKVPHMGKDGKTGETLLKTVLAPLFASRNLEVLSWVGYNILGNMDGKALNEPDRKASKIQTKGASLAKLLPHQKPFHKVGIDYVPSLGDWKTAWDFIHFQGFLQTKMSLQFVWQGSDSMLAAPLVLDLIRLVCFSWQKGEFGPLVHLASFFKNPLSFEDHHFYHQYSLLEEYVARHSSSNSPPTSTASQK